jgi:hypothetical protein
MRIKISRHVDRFIKSGKQYVHLFEFPKKPERYVSGLTWFMLGLLAGLLIANYFIMHS